MKRIGIMGGTFNPIHNGHLSIAEEAREQFRLKKVLFMPSGIPYMKDRHEVLPVDVRCEMTALAIADRPYFKLSKLEAEDAAQGKNTYTCDTLRKLRTADPEADYFFVLGADSLFAIEDWKNPAFIFENCTILAAVRTTEQANSNAAPVSLQDQLLGQARYLRKTYHAAVEILKFAGMDVSSTQIREKVRRGESVSGLVPEGVASYIQSHHLYENNS